MGNQRRNGIWKRLTAAALSVVLLAGMLPAGLPALAAEPQAEQTEQADTAWVQGYLDQLVQWGVMRGDLEGNLAPDREISRAEYVTMINRAYGYDQPGTIPFEDVLPSDWYYDDTAIAYRAGYFSGTSENTASPTNILTREEAAVILGRNLMLRATPGEATEFSDGRDLSDWSRGVIKSAAEMEVVKGYPDGSFKPQNNITRGEVASLLVNAIGTPISSPGDYSLGSVYGNVTVSSSGVTLRNTTIAGDLYISSGVGLGFVTLENVTVLGRIVASGAGESNKGENSIILRNVTAEEMVVDSPANQYVTIRAEGDTDIAKTSVRTPAYLEDVSPVGLGLKYIELDGEEGTGLELAGNIGEVLNLTPNSNLVIAQGSALQVTVDEKAYGSKVSIQNGGEIKTLNLDVATSVGGQGDIDHLNVNANGSTVTILPDTITVRPGISGNISGENMDTVIADEASQAPRILSGYPDARDIAPTTALGAFSTNKQGTIYWAISAVSDGSVGEDDLINPPTYNAKILSNGNLKVGASNTELTAKITKLTSDGSYYLSAVLVDVRGEHSPVKVTSFSTPDDTVPNFASGSPVMTLMTKEKAQVSVMPTKSCQLYYALLPKGSTAPTPADFKANAITGNLGYGSLDVKKNTNSVLPVNSRVLEELATYDLYLWLTDFDGVKSSAVKKLTFTTVDGTPPQYVTEPYMTAQKDTSVTFSGSLNEAGTLFWVVVKSGTEYPKPMAGQGTGKVSLDSETAKLQVASGMNALKSGRVNMTENKDAPFNITGLTSETSYDLYYVAQDKAGNYSASVQKETFNTLDNNAPTAKIEFTKFNGNETGTPLADTDIRIVFSERVQTFPEGKILDELYAAVTSAASEDARDEARDELAATLEGVLTLYDLTGGEESVATVRNSSNAESVGDSWTVDYRYAKVEQEDSKTVITLPTEAGGLNLRSGSTYRIDVKGLSDASRNAIGTLPLPDKKGFTTVFAQVNLKVTNSYTIDDPDGGPNQIDLHMCFSATPISTEKVSDTIFWDMLIWSDTSIQFTLYRRENSSDASWENVGTGGITVATGDDEFVGTSLRTSVENEPRFERLNQLKGDYEYGIRVTTLDGNNAEDTWNATLNMKVGIAAGSNNELDNLSSRVVREAWQSAVDNREITSIGNCVAQGSDEMSMKRVFSDKVEPKFANGFPTFDVTDSGLTMRVMLDRPGTIFYVVAPLGDVATTLADGSKVDENDRKNYMKLPDLTTPNHTLTPIELSTPDYLNIVGDKLSGSNPDIRWGRRDRVSVSAVSITVSDLMAETDYVVYYVLVGESSSVYSSVLGARFTTPKITRPIITLELSNPSVKMQADRQTYVDYILMTDNQAQFPSILKETLLTLDPDSGKLVEGKNWNSAAGDAYKDAYGHYTVWEALCEDITQEGVSTGSVFDWCASDGLKNSVADLIRNRQTGGTIVRKDATTLQGATAEYVDFSESMTAGTSYFLLAVGKVPPPQSSSDAFRAIRPVEKLDGEAPVITSISAALTLKANTTDHYEGTLSIGFSEGVYFVERSSAGSPGTYTPIEATPWVKASSGFMSLSTAITTAPRNFKIETERPKTAMTAVQFSFTDIQVGESFMFVPNLGDSSGNVHKDATLTLTLKVDDAQRAYFEISPEVWKGAGVQ